MSRSSSSRGQTEPIAAIVAVGMLAVGIGVYAASVQTVLPGTSDETTAERTIDRVWDDIQDDGVFHANGDDIERLVSDGSLPADATVAITVTSIVDGEERTVAETGLPSGHPRETTAADIADLERYLEAEGVPKEASVATRSIPVAVENRADVRSGTLEVSVW